MVSLENGRNKLYSKGKTEMIMYLEHSIPTYASRGAFYILTLSFILVYFFIPPISYALTVSYMFNTFIVSFLASVCFYHGWLRENTVHAWTVE